MQKIFVLDTNILMSTEGSAISGFADNHVVISSVVLEELDNHKSDPGERGFQARESIRKIDEVIGSKQPCGKRYQIGDGPGTLEIFTDASKISHTWDLYAEKTQGWTKTKADNAIIMCALAIKSINTISGNDMPVVLVTNDISMKIKAISVDLTVQDYRNDRISEDFTYTGRAFVENPEIDIDKLYREKQLSVTDETLDGIEFVENQYIHVTNGVSSALCRYHDGALHVLVNADTPIYGITGKNQGQKFALDALSDPDIPLVILKGPAGVGKTLLALAAGLNHTYVNQRKHGGDGRLYDKIVCARSNTLADADIGFLPGTLEQKTLPLLAPVTDNLTYIFSKNEESREQVAMQVDDLFDDGVIEVCSLAYIRGRSLSNTYIIIDEAQNLSRLQAKTLVTRVGPGSKIVFMGDTDQIDNAKLDRRTCGISYLSEKFKNSPLCAQLEFDKDESVRSKLAVEAIKLLGND